MAYNLLSWHGYRATTTRGRKWAQLAGILTGDQKVDLFDHLRAFKRRPVPTVEKLRGRAQSSSSSQNENLKAFVADIAVKTGKGRSTV